MSEIKALEIPVDVKIGATHPHLAQYLHAERRRLLEAPRRRFRVHIRRKGLSGRRCIILLVSAVGLEYTGSFPARQPSAKARRQALADVAKIPIDAPRARARAGEHQSQDPFRMTHRIGLREDAAEGVTQYHEPRQLQVLSHALDVLHHAIQRIALRVLEALRAARSALVDQHQLTAARQRLKRGKKVRVIRPGSPMQQQQRHTATQGFEIDSCAGSLDETLAHSRSL